MHTTSYNLDGSLPDRIGERRKDAIALLGKYNKMHFHYSTAKSIYGAIDDSNNSDSLNGFNKFSSKNIQEIAKELTKLSKETRKCQSSNMLSFNNIGKKPVALD